MTGVDVEGRVEAGVNVDGKKKPVCEDSNILENGLKLAGETLVTPGASLILDGEFGDGAWHVAGAVLAHVTVGPLGLVLIAADSYMKSVSGTGLLNTTKRR